MELERDAKLLRIFIGENDRKGQKPLYEEIVFEAKKRGLMGVTVTRGIMGFGANTRIHRSKFLEISADLPLVIEIVDTEEKVRAFTEVIEALFEETASGGLITLEKAEVIRYKPGNRMGG
ncbi:MAG TPA: DUF190 domain-containing protein [Bacteroidales bacterium]|nr:DUF190 domain-containing protein [Bacteroidales bacterium]HPS62694.1 DUF190 domain-containing protein [Bacteroidales bacterium]